MWPRFGSIAMAVVACARLALAEGPVSVSKIVRESPAQRLFITRVNLADPRVSLQIASGGPDPDGPGPWETVLKPPSAIARDHDFSVTINPVYFAHQAPDGDLKKYAAGEPAAAMNLVAVDGRPVSRRQDGAALWFDCHGRAHMDLVESMPPDARTAVAGSNLILKEGQNLAGAGDGTRHPRTAAGLTADGKTLVLLVADGRRTGWAAGLTLSELAAEMAALGCTTAINFDGGGSSTMVIKDPQQRYRVLNTPSDGSQFIVPMSIERPVPYVLGVKIKG
jgi:hypothetical protein